MRNVPGKSCRENYNTHFVFNNALSEYGAVYEIMWKNIKYGTGSQTGYR
jgi:hypothetical protein